ncbi:caveolin-1-like [Haliotis rubra]|uniref:caveolin-1-like n=1 Tax=Haliotis rubra TaxID=36100 RepID=UPI001EE5C0A3|nr:caveolin-1-like [Haliotis rubra]
MDIDLTNRDPNNINDHIQVTFEDILAEPEGIHSLDCVWVNSFRCFNCWKSCVYNLLTFFYGIYIAARWGCEFAVVAFAHIWIITPMYKFLELNCGCIKKFYGMCVHCLLDPCCEGCGLLFQAFQKH